MKNDASPRALLLTVIGLFFSVVPVAAAILCYFPLWQHDGAKLLSGTVLLLLLGAALPLWRLIRDLLRSPAVWMLWLIAFVLFFLLSRIADEMTVISFVGTVGNLIGALFLKLAEGGKPDEEQI